MLITTYSYEQNTNFVQLFTYSEWWCPIILYNHVGLPEGNTYIYIHIICISIYKYKYSKWLQYLYLTFGTFSQLRGGPSSSACMRLLWCPDISPQNIAPQSSRNCAWSCGIGISTWSELTRVLNKSETCSTSDIAQRKDNKNIKQLIIETHQK